MLWLLKLLSGLRLTTFAIRLVVLNQHIVATFLRLLVLFSRVRVIGIVVDQVLCSYIVFLLIITELLELFFERN